MAVAAVMLFIYCLAKNELRWIVALCQNIKYKGGVILVAYLDLIILENFCMNYLILFTTGKLLNRAVKKSRIVMASFIGVIYVFSLYFNFSNLVLNLSKIVMGAILVKLSFNSNKFVKVFKELIVFFMVSFIYAGCTLGFVHFFKPKVIYIVNGIIIGGEYIFELVIISAIVSYALIKMSMKLIKMKQKLNKRDMLCNIELFNRGKSVKLTALLDTGNLLTDPVSKDPVVIVDKKTAKKLFDEDYFNRIDTLIGGGDFSKDEFCDARLKIIPYISVGNKNGIMVAYKIDKMKVEYQDEINEIDDVLIGFYNDALSINNKYSALIGLQILERSRVKNEYNTIAKGKGKYSICKIHQ